MQEKDKTQNAMAQSSALPLEVIQAAQSELRDRLAQLWLQGVRHFPLVNSELFPQPTHLEHQHKPSDHSNDDGSECDEGAQGIKQGALQQGLARLAVGLAQCRACSVCTDERHAFWQDPERAAESHSGNKKIAFLAVIDQPFTGSTLALDLEDKSFPNNLILRLLERAGIRLKTHIVYALRSIPVQMPSSSMVKTCAETWLRQELATLQPKFVFCFGGRAKAALEYALGSLQTHQTEVVNDVAHGVFPEGGADEARFVWRGAELQARFFPSSLELQQYPSWRQAVWAQVTQAAKSIA